ncbi:branched-chain amino acid transport system ATP-binding protein [Rhodoligotrophos appendicifer]|uniref:ABC transporter ATP-binding protein n=1 Tax=Rhodoligotrophos appendicifer TaxID=987056 RepID=UPI001185F62C|nr:ABC transporter ATP-binding protein [Rhodoligotrophos appendicifer]
MSLRLDAVSKSFGGLLAVSDLSLEVRPGTVTGLIGPNGAGKTTVVNLISGILAPTVGTISFEDRDITTYSPTDVALTGIVRTFQNVRLLLDATVLENVALGLYRHGTASWLSALLGLPSATREKRAMRDEARELLGSFGLGAYPDALVGSLSYGHQRRVEIARALAARPKLLLLDEPVAGMNDVEAGELGDIFVDLAAKGMAVLLVEHNMRLVTAVCRDVYVLDTGRLIASGTPEAALRSPAVQQAYLGA